MSINDLFKDIKGIIQETSENTQQGINKVTTIANWEVGNRINKEELNGKKRAVYGEGLIASLSEKLTEHYGRGFSKQNLHRMKQFAGEYKKTQIDHRINWSKYVLLLGVTDPEKRKKLETEIVKLKLSRDQLHQRIKSRREDSDTNAKESYANMYRPEGELYLYRTRAVNEGSKTEYYLDLGFKVWLSREQAGLSRPRADQIIQSTKTKKGYNLKPYTGEKSRHYLYKGRLDHVVDGDTLVVNVELGFGIQVQQSFRFRNVNAPNLKNDAGQAAREYLKRQVKKEKYLLIKTRSRDKFDRYVSDIFLWNGRTTVENVLSDGSYLNQIMLDSGHGVYAPGG